LSFSPWSSTPPRHCLPTPYRRVSPTSITTMWRRDPSTSSKNSTVSNRAP
jgi:hypothetical protein